MQGLPCQSAVDSADEWAPSPSMTAVTRSKKAADGPLLCGREAVTDLVHGAHDRRPSIEEHFHGVRQRADGHASPILAVPDRVRSIPSPRGGPPARSPMPIAGPGDGPTPSVRAARGRSSKPQGLHVRGVHSHAPRLVPLQFVVGGEERPHGQHGPAETGQPVTRFVALVFHIASLEEILRQCSITLI